MFKLPKLPYTISSLEPHISEKNLDLHYNKHHAGYVDNLNKLIKGTDYEDLSLERIISSSFGSIYNNAAQHWNHSFLWKSMSPNGGNPVDPLASVINKTWNGYDDFKKELITRGKKLFGSGWLWLAFNTQTGNTILVETNNAGSLCPQENNKYIPLMVIDVWEHAYYPTYSNEREKYLEAFWKIFNWEFASKNYEVAVA